MSTVNQRFNFRQMAVRTVMIVGLTVMIRWGWIRPMMGGRCCCPLWSVIMALIMALSLMEWEWCGIIRFWRASLQHNIDVCRLLSMANDRFYLELIRLIKAQSR